ncbi:hypothetical protein OH456_07585 [Vibrio sp. La 4.2.2]|uniref:hypothetical protein n=1 Tax=Vibrio sp. La 4.2.2 TaxID=2998830 RepID=UPI0022CE2C68|nr:hypothetical protein [Vibrio sp. La 4.2.2]MDA0108000.1 hypothetical protein [Vibrio sp. La 4.2.2]
MAVTNSKKILTFEQLSSEITAIANCKVLFDFPNEPNHVIERQYGFLQINRPTIRYTAFTTPHALILYSALFKPECALQTRLHSPEITLMITTMESQSVCFNGSWINTDQVAIVSSRSEVPFALFIPQNTTVILSEIAEPSRKLKSFSDSLVPVTVSKRNLDKFKAVGKFVFEQPTEKQGHGGTKAVLDLITVLLDELPPLRPQSLHGPSRRPRKHLMTKIVKMMEQKTTRVMSLKQIANELDISTKSINLFFKEYLFIAPKRFYLLVNLFKFRNILIQGKCSSVLEATVLSGVDGWSRYSERYQKLFGEKPYDTFMKSK